MRLEDLADYTAAHRGFSSTHYRHLYAHASVGCLHVRPVINLKSEIEGEDACDRRGG